MKSHKNASLYMLNDYKIIIFLNWVFATQLFLIKSLSVNADKVGAYLKTHQNSHKWKWKHLASNPTKRQNWELQTCIFQNKWVCIGE